MGAAREQIGPQLHAARAQRLRRVREGRQRNPRIGVAAGEVNRRPGRRGGGSSIRRNADPATRQRRHGVRRGQTCAKILDGEAGALREAGQKHWLSGRRVPGRSHYGCEMVERMGKLRASDRRQRIDGARVPPCAAGRARQDKGHGRRGEPRHHMRLHLLGRLTAAVDEDADRLRLRTARP